MPVFKGSPENAYTQRVDYDVAGNEIYSGYAIPGTLPSAAGWAIQRSTYTGTNATLIEWANGNNLLNNIWDNRAGLSYA